MNRPAQIKANTDNDAVEESEMSAQTQSSKDGIQIEFWDDVFNAIFVDDPGKAALMGLRSSLLLKNLSAVKAWDGTQAQKAKRLKITLSHLKLLLLRGSDATLFPLDDLTALSTRAGYEPVVIFNKIDQVDTDNASADDRSRARAESADA